MQRLHYKFIRAAEVKLIWKRNKNPCLIKGYNPYGPMITEHKSRINYFLQGTEHMTSLNNEEKVALIFMWFFGVYFDVYNYVQS